MTLQIMQNKAVYLTNIDFRDPEVSVCVTAALDPAPSCCSLN